MLEVFFFHPTVGSNQIRLLLPFILTLLSAFALYDYQKKGLSRKSLGYWVLCILLSALFALGYEFYTLFMAYG